ncbi:acyl-CoA dehydrogenase family protein [Amycolatopsis pithecellobii]|uniref:acyl-CoA dehydrogenase family protein n=1 Tax=Amycolatopsis pithecellobii TaxID=664692 RepID=UPI0035E45DFA
MPEASTPTMTLSISESRVRIEQLLLVLKTAGLMGTVGNEEVHSEVQAIKIATAATVQWILDKAFRAHGAAGLSPDHPLAQELARVWPRRFADGPGEAHDNSLAKSERRRQKVTGRRSHTRTPRLEMR